MSTVNAEIWIVLSRRIGLKLKGFFVTKAQLFLVALPPREGRHDRVSPEMRKDVLRSLAGPAGPRDSEEARCWFEGLSTALKSTGNAVRSLPCLLQSSQRLRYPETTARATHFLEKRCSRARIPAAAISTTHDDTPISPGV